MKLKVIPLTIKRANEIVAQWHRHNRPVHGAKWALGAEIDGRLVGVVIVGRAVARVLDNSHTVEVTRLCTTPEAPQNTCSFLYSAARRVWQSMGGKKVITYTLASEGGSSLRAAGWLNVAKIKGGGWNRPGRPREEQTIYMQEKFRWETP